MLKKVRVALAAVVFAAALLLFAAFSAPVIPWLGWVAKIQIIPALLAANFAVVAVIAIVTLVFGRVYCSVVCPLGIFQDIVSFFGGKVKKNRFSFRKNNKWLRYAILAAFAVLMFLGLTAWAALIEPYGIFGRAFSAGGGYIAVIAGVTIVAIAVMAWFGGRLWCGNICPAGTLLGIISKYSLFKPVIDPSKCTGCTICARNCKCSCINPSEHSVDTSRCVACMDCIGKCNQGAIEYKFVGWRRKNAGKGGVDESRRAFVTSAAMALSAATLGAQSVAVDGGLAVLEDKKTPCRKSPLKPAGARSLKHFTKNCIGCQLCVTKCPEKVLRPSTSPETLMQPEINYDRGFCRIGCTRCSQVCPTGAIEPVTVAEKSSVSIGHAVWIPENCVVRTNGDSCGNCARHCPTGAITMVPLEGNDKLKIPSVNASRCIGCGSCEYHCPARPYSAIYVVGHEVHHEI